MHIWTRLKPEAQGKTGLGIYPDGMVEHDAHVGELLRKSTKLGPDRFTWAVGRVLLILEHESRALRWRRAELNFRTSAFLNRSASLWLRGGIWRGRQHLPFELCFLGTASATIGWSELCQVL
jgi:hypothetical protein